MPSSQPTRPRRAPKKSPDGEQKKKDERLPFSSFDISELLLNNVHRLGFELATPIQTRAIPPALKGRDLIGRAQTGTGKTLAFGIPMIEKFLHEPGAGLRGLVLAPTRELAIQIHEVLTGIVEGTDFKIGLIYGGSSLSEQMMQLRRGMDIMVATPGRLLDFQGRGMVRLEGVEVFVLDEADQMMDLGFLPQLKMIFESFYAHPQTLLFSATMPKEMRRLANRYLKNPQQIEVGATHHNPVDKVTQSVVHVNRHNRFTKLKRILDEENGPVVIFAGTKRNAEELATLLNRAYYRTARLHGDMDQDLRRKTVVDFHAGKYKIMVATDVAARGLDFQNIAHVINYDLPRAPEDHIHRIGRTARNGAEGKATTLVLDNQRRKLKAFRTVLGNAG